MKQPEGDFRDEIDEILKRDIKTLATARDVPRLYKRIKIYYENHIVYDGEKGESCLSFLRTVKDVCKEEVDVIEEENDGDTIRTFAQSLKTGSKALFILKCTNQNIIAPCILRMKWAFSRVGEATKDSGYWVIEVSVRAAQIQISHIRKEEDANNGNFTYTWKLTINQNDTHVLKIEDVETNDENLREKLKKILEDCASNSVSMPGVEEYKNPKYFNWK